MDLRFSPEEIAFRDEVRHFFSTQIPEAIRLKTIEGRKLAKEDIVTAHKILHRQGWATPSWPQAWGGTGWTPIQQYIFMEELQSSGSPQPLQFNVQMCGPVLLQFASEEMKKRFLPRMAALDDWWCQGFSEPGSGSDLASLKTTAKRDGDTYVVNGQKIWTTLAQYADWIFCLVRTDMTAKKQEGISFLLVDMKSKGVTVRPIQTIDGSAEVNEVFFDDVRVPVENLVGQENKGWDYAKFLLGNERVGIARVGVSKERIRRIRELAKIEFDGDRPMIENPRFLEKLSAVEIELKALEITQLRVVAAERNRGGKPDPASSVLKIKGSEIQQATTELLMDIMGPYAAPTPLDDDGSNELPVAPDYAGTAAPTYFNWRKISIYGGSNEIQRNIIAKAVLGL